MQPGEAATEGEDEQHAGFDGGIEHAGACPVYGVVGSLLVRGQCDALGELSRHGITVSAHVTDLAPGEQQAATKGQGAGDQENNGQGFGHGRRQKL